MVYKFSSTSKISFPGSGIAAIAASDANLADIRKQMRIQTIGHDKLNQLRHARYFGNIHGMVQHMKKHADILRPKFDIVLKTLDKELGGLGIGSWLAPRGVYFISFDSMDGCAKAIVAKAKESLKDAKTVEEINKIVEDAAGKVEKVKKEASDAEKLEKKKKTYQAKLDNLVKNVTDSELKTTLSKIVDSAKADISNATSEEQMNEILTKAKNDIKNTTVEYSKNKALATKKAQLIEKLTSLADGKSLSSEALSIISQAKTDIMDASTSEDAVSIYNTAVASFKETYVNDLHTSYKEKLDALAPDASSTLDDTTKAKINDTITKAKENIDKTSSEDAMKQIYDQAEKSVSLLKENSSSLDKVKEDAINELKNYTTLNTESVQKVISAYTNKIQSATSEDQVKQYLSDAKGLLDKLNAAAGITSSTDQNGGTSTGSTASGTDVQSASKKGDDTPTSSVKTGDENGFNIIASVAALIVGIGAVGALIYMKFFKKK